MLKLLGAMAAMMSSVGGVAEGGAMEPIHVVAEPMAQGIRLQVIGASSGAYEASFSLEVTGGGNRSLHRGSAKLRGGDPVILSTVTIGNVKPGQWRARLLVEPQGQEPYEQIRTSY